MDHRKQSFTLIELMIVVVIIGVIAGFAIPTYSRALIKTHERDMIVRVEAVYAAGKIYFAKHNQYPGGWLDTAGLANTFGISLTNTDAQQHFNFFTPHCLEAHYIEGSWDFHVMANLEEPLSNINPCCGLGEVCPTLVNCTYTYACATP